MITLYPDTGVREHPVIRPARPVAQVLASGPGRYSWRVHESSDAALESTRVHRAYAAGHVSAGADCTQEEMSAARRAAEAEARDAVAGVRRELAARDRAEARRLAEGGMRTADIAVRVARGEAEVSGWTEGIGLTRPQRARRAQS